MAVKAPPRDVGSDELEGGMSTLEEMEKYVRQECPKGTSCTDRECQVAIKFLCGKIDEIESHIERLAKIMRDDVKDILALVDIVNSHGRSLMAHRQKIAELQEKFEDLAAANRKLAESNLDAHRRIDHLFIKP